MCGEEPAFIESLEGKRGYPPIKPPYFPAVLGLYMCPTIVNNVETLCNIKHIVAMGGAAFAKLGKPNNTGTRLLCVSGDVEKPGYYEFEVGALTIGQLLNDVCGGVIVMDETRDMVECLANIAAFYAHESCGQCTPCREGSLWMKKITHRLTHGHGQPDDVALLVNVADNIAGKTICAFGEACAWP